MIDAKVESCVLGESLMQFINLDEILSCDFLSIPGILDKNNKLDEFKKALSNTLEKSIEIKSNWLNLIKPSAVDNNLGWHVDDKYPGTYVGIYWVMGELIKVVIF